MSYFDDYYDSSGDSGGSLLPPRKPLFPTGVPDPENYLQMAGMYSPQTDYFNQEDPRFKRYVDLASQAPPSEGILSDIISRRPQEDNYELGTGKKIGGFLLSTLAGMKDPTQSYRTSKAFAEEPYHKALASWTAESKFADDRARLADAARNRELGTLKFGMQQDAGARRAKALDERYAAGLQERLAGKAVGFNNKDEDQERTRLNAEALAKAREAALGNRESALDLARKRLELEQTRFDASQKPKAPTQLEKDRELRSKLQETASGLGVPYRTTTPAPQIAEAVAWKELLSDPVLKQYVTFDEENSKFNVDPNWKSIVQKRVQARIHSMLAGLD